MRYNDLKDTIEKVIKTNNSQEITALALQDTLKSMVDVTQSEQEGATSSLTAYVKEQDGQIRSALTATDTRLTALANNALTAANTASETAQTAYNNAVEAKNTAGNALSQANSANQKAGDALATAGEAAADSSTAVAAASEANLSAKNALTKAGEAVTSANAAAEVARNAKTSADSALQKATYVENNVDSALETAKSAENTAQSALSKANTAEGTANAAATTATQAKETAESVVRNAIPYSEKGQPGGVATLDENGDLAQFRMTDLIDSYLSDRTDTAPTARALHALHQFHQTDILRMTDEVNAVLDLIKGVAGLGVAPTQIDITGSGTATSITIVTNDNWTLTCDADWITADKSGGAGRSVVQLTISANSSDTARTGNITVSTALGNTATVVVNQGVVVITTEYTLSVSPSSLYFAGGGETKAITVVSQKQTYKNGVAQGAPATVDYTPEVTGSGFSMTGTDITAAPNQTTNTPSGSVKITQAESGKTATVSLSQAAGVQTIEYSEWATDSLTPDASVKTIPATGGTSVLSCKANQSRNKYTKWNGVTTATVKETQIISVTPEYSKVSGSGTLSGTTVSFGNNTSTDSTEGVYEAGFSGKTATVTITQTKGEKQYGKWSISVSPSASSIEAAGGSVTITASASRPWTWNGVAGSGETQTAVPTLTLSNPSAGFTLSGSTLTAANNTTTEVRNVTVTAAYDDASQPVSVSQKAGAKVYEKPVISFSYANITPQATSATPAMSYSQVWTWNGAAGSGGTQTTGATVSYALEKSQSGFTAVNATTGALTATNMGTTLGSRTSALVTVTVTMNKQESKKTATCTQGENKQTLASITTIATPATIPAAGGTAVLSTTAVYSYTSGATSSPVAVEAVYSKVSGNGTLSGSTVTYTNNTSTSKLEGVYRGTYGGKVSSGPTIPQNPGVRYDGAWTVNISASATTISAAGGNSNISASASRSYTWNNVPGSGGTESAAPVLSWANGSTGYAGFTLSGTTVTAANRGSVQGSSRACTVRAAHAGITREVSITQNQNVLRLSSYNGGFFKPSLTGSYNGGVAYMDVTTNGPATWSSGATVASGVFITELVQFSFDDNYSWARFGAQGSPYKWTYDSHTGSGSRSLKVCFSYYDTSEVLKQSGYYTFIQEKALTTCSIRISGPILSGSQYGYKAVATVPVPTGLTVVGEDPTTSDIGPFWISAGEKESSIQYFNKTYTPHVKSVNGNTSPFQHGDYYISWA